MGTSGGGAVRAAWWAAIFGLVGAVIGAAATAYVNDQNLESQREAQAVQLQTERDYAVRELRRPVYLDFTAAANRWATSQALAGACPNLRKCEINQGDLDAARHGFQVAINSMFIYGSSEAQKAARAVGSTLPPSQNGVSGYAVLGEVDEDGFAKEIVAFENLMCRDVSLAPEDCLRP